MELAWAPGGDKLAVVIRRTVEGQPRSELWLVSRDGGFRRMVIRATLGRAIHDLQWFADSLYLLYGLSTAADSAMTEVWRGRLNHPARPRGPPPPPPPMLRPAPPRRPPPPGGGGQGAGWVGGGGGR